jgi:3-isopropylmalate dehydratase small subunit
VRHTGVVACIDVRREDGDMLTPDEMFAPVRGATVLVAQEPFEALSPETALARMKVLGVRAIVSPGFEPRFYRLCVSTGVLALPLEEEEVDALAGWAESRPEATVTIDLDKQLLELPPESGIEPRSFDVDSRVRKKLLLGLTDEEEMLQHAGSTSALRSEDRKRRPWLYGDA